MPLRKPSEFNLIDFHRGVEDVASGPNPESLHTHIDTHTNKGAKTHTHREKLSFIHSGLK